MSRVLVVGSTAYDLLLSSDGSFADGISAQDIDTLSVAFLAQRFARHHGGTGANIAWNLNLLGGQPLLVSTVGNDGGEYLALLKERGVDVKYIEQLEEHATATAIVSTDSAERQITFFHPGADQHGSWPDLSQERDDISYAIISPRDIKLMLESIEWCKKFSVPYIFDPGQQILSFGSDELHRAVKGSAGVVLNEYEWSLFSKVLNCTEENIQSHTPLLVITRGEHGVTYFNADGARNVASCKPDQIINPTGAGDAFRAGLLTGLSSGWDILDCVRLGASMGSFAVESEGTLMDQLDVEQVWLRADMAYRESLPEGTQ